MDASWGYTAEEGLNAVLGGKNMEKVNKGEGAMSPSDMRDYILDAPIEKDISYSDNARRFAKAILFATKGKEEEFLDDSESFADKIAKQGERYGLTGFMFGWAFNVVRYILGEQPQSNPAIGEIEY